MPKTYHIVKLEHTPMAMLDIGFEMFEINFQTGFQNLIWDFK